MARIGYARVSTDDQHAEAQSERLMAAGYELVFADKGVGGVLKSRPELDKCLAYLRAGDALVTVKLDRLGRSVANLIELARDLESRGVDLVCLDQPINTTNAAGKLFFTLLAAFAEFERELIRERTRDGLRGSTKRSGRPPRLTDGDLLLARMRLEAEGAAFADVARELGMHRATLYRALERDGYRHEGK